MRPVTDLIVFDFPLFSAAEQARVEAEAQEAQEAQEAEKAKEAQAEKW